MRKILSLLFMAAAMSLNCSAITVKLNGFVKDTDGRPVKGAVISDGINFTKTSATGRYALSSDSDRSYCVFVIASSDYEVPTDSYGKYIGYALIDSTVTRQNVDFRLTRLKTPRTEYSVIFEADPQQMSSRPHSVTSWQWVSDRLAEYAGEFSRPVYHIILGDMVTNEIEVPGKAEQFLREFDKIGLKTMFVAGNHDHIHGASSFRKATSCFAKHFGPYNTAVNIGGVHYIFLDSCAWEEGTGKYQVGLNDETVAFLEGDLAFVPTDTPVMVCTHCPLTQSLDGKYPHLTRDMENYDRFIAALKGRDVQMWYGHTHLNAQNAYTEEELSKFAPGVKSLDSHLVGRVGGAWSCSGEITMDGCPRGVVVADVNGTDISWHYHSLMEGFPEDFNVYAPGMFSDKPSTLFCNVYVWDEKWEKPRWYENGVLVGEMEKVIDSEDACHDPLYAKLYPEWVAAGRVNIKVRNEPSKASYCNHLFCITPSAGVHCGEIRFKDRFGREYSRTVSW